ncbi:hypothetical protein CRG98_011124 [Punica granatum]|uniref:DDE Tnp4 domain-containing protein n=1 Tax=Punica granatum TaxID=22663 RepID=A0A2I0KKZ2_PUNGR|nr:hypothetical protein CRG98_011124 [Punica granatum]
MTTTLETTRMNVCNGVTSGTSKASEWNDTCLEIYATHCGCAVASQILEKHCIGAIDGTHVDACMPHANRVPYRDRNADISQNILAACTHDMMFTYVMTGWEGSAHNSRILSDAASLDRFPAPRGRQYYIVDAGFSNIPGYLAPSKGERYHRSDFPNHYPPTSEKELFNHRHALVRNVIERCFGILKKRFAILTAMTNFKPYTQGELVLACFVLYNFIRRNNYHDRLFMEYGDAWADYDLR